LTRVGFVTSLRPCPGVDALELLADGPPDRSPPPARVLYGWLRRPAEAGLAVRTGSGNRYAPFRFTLLRPAPPSVLSNLPE